MILKCPTPKCNQILTGGPINYDELHTRGGTKTSCRCSLCSKVFYFDIKLIKEETIKSESHSSLSED